VGSGSTSASGATSNVLPAIDRNELASNRVPTTSQTAAIHSPFAPDAIRIAAG
jgi:hypothetical protein